MTQPPPYYKNSPVVVIGISGASRSGKTRLAQEIEAHAQLQKIPCRIIGQDEFWVQSVAIQSSQKQNSNQPVDSHVAHSQEDYACTDWDDFVDKVEQELQELRGATADRSTTAARILVLEGFQVLYDERLRSHMNLVYHLDLDRDTCVNRRSDDGDPHNLNPANRSYCETVLWPQHLLYEEAVVRPLLQACQGQENPVIRLLRPESPNSSDIANWLSEIIQDFWACPITQFCRDYAKLSNNYQAWLDETRSQDNNGNASSSTTPVVLLSTGSYNPVHSQHVQIFEEARIRMEQQGFRCLAGFLSPSHDEYVGSKLGRRGGGHLLSRHRFEMIRLATKQSNWIGPHSWEMKFEGGFVDFGPVLMEIRQQIRAWLGTDAVQVRYLCGMDHAVKCGLLGTQFGATLGTVILGRPESDKKAFGRKRDRRPQQRKRQKSGVLVFDDEALLSAESAIASSTRVREMIIEHPTKRIPLLHPAVERYLRENAKSAGDIYSNLAPTAEP